MKRSRIAMLATVAAGALMVLGLNASAQDTEKKPETKAPPAQGGARRQGGQRGDQLQQMSEQLNLTADQKEKLKPILEEQAKKMRALRDDTNLSQEDRRTKMREIREAGAAKIKPILTKEQVEKWDKMRQQGRQGGPGQGQGRQRPPQGQGQKPQ